MNDSVGVPHGKVHRLFMRGERIDFSASCKFRITSIHVVDFVRQERSTIETTVELMK